MLTPSYTYYTDSLPAGVGGTTKTFVIAIRPQYKDDERMHMHELEHVRQFWSLFAIIGLIGAAIVYTQHLLPLFYLHAALIGFSAHTGLYNLVARYRFWAEAKAYAIQTKPDRSDIDVMAYRLFSSYDLGITLPEAKAAILSHL